jgi:rSAM/selenodomain-associated transferase 1
MFPANPETAPRIGVAILAKAPIPGYAKTRLIPVLGSVGAADLQRWLLQRTVATALAADVGPVSLWCAGDQTYSAFALCHRFAAVAVRRQPEGDLGVRMLTAVIESPMAAGTLVIGTDCPALTPTHLREAAQSLRAYDAVVLPAEDGGYVLIGMREPIAGVFAGIDWGTERVMAQTRERLAALGRRWEEPATLWDLDRPADLDRLSRWFTFKTGS